MKKARESGLFYWALELLQAGGAEPALTALCFVELINNHELGRQEGDEQDLGNTHTGLDHQGFLALVYEDHAYVARVVAINEARAIQYCRPILVSQARARNDQTCNALGDAHMESGFERKPVARLERQRFSNGCAQV